MKSDFTQTVECGASRLDAVAPGWEDAVDTDRLAVRRPAACVPAQVFGDFRSSLEAPGVGDASGHGFAFPTTVPHGGRSVREALDGARAEAIGRRRSASRVLAEVETAACEPVGAG
jgi:hypothetical protein